jgi:hypothetical protein
MSLIIDFDLYDIILIHVINQTYYTYMVPTTLIVGE